MPGIVNYFPDGYMSLIRHQMRTPIQSLEVGGKDDLMNISMDPHHHVTMEMVSDKRKENLIDTSVVGNPGGLNYVSMTIAHGTNNTDEHSTLTLNITNLASALQGALTQLINLEARVTALENA